MKQRLFFLLVFVFSLTPSFVSPQQTATTEDGRRVILYDNGTWKYLQEPTKTPQVSQTVYVTGIGSKYHSAGCRYLNRSRIPMVLKGAAKRYGPCSVCSPPLLKSATPQKQTVSPSKTYGTPGQCAAITKKARCKRNAIPGSKYCWQHRGKVW